MTDVPAFDAELDACGLNCPLPLLKAKLELNRLASGAVLKVIATDAGSLAITVIYTDTGWRVVGVTTERP